MRRPTLSLCVLAAPLAAWAAAPEVPRELFPAATQLPDEWRQKLLEVFRAKTPDAQQAGQLLAWLEAMDAQRSRRYSQAQTPSLHSPETWAQRRRVGDQISNQLGRLEAELRSIRAAREGYDFPTGHPLGPRMEEARRALWDLEQRLRGQRRELEDRLEARGRTFRRGLERLRQYRAYADELRQRLKGWSDEVARTRRVVVSLGPEVLARFRAYEDADARFQAANREAEDARWKRSNGFRVPPRLQQKLDDARRESNFRWSLWLSTENQLERQRADLERAGARLAPQLGLARRRFEVAPDDPPPPEGHLQSLFPDEGDVPAPDDLVAAFRARLDDLRETLREGLLAKLWFPPRNEALGVDLEDPRRVTASFAALEALGPLHDQVVRERLLPLQQHLLKTPGLSPQQRRRARERIAEVEAALALVRDPRGLLDSRQAITEAVDVLAAEDDAARRIATPEGIFRIETIRNRLDGRVRNLGRTVAPKLAALPRDLGQQVANIPRAQAELKAILDAEVALGDPGKAAPAAPDSPEARALLRRAQEVLRTLYFELRTSEVRATAGAADQLPGILRKVRAEVPDLQGLGPRLQAVIDEQLEDWPAPSEAPGSRRGSPYAISLERRRWKSYLERIQAALASYEAALADPDASDAARGQAAASLTRWLDGASRWLRPGSSGLAARRKALAERLGEGGLAGAPEGSPGQRAETCLAALREVIEDWWSQRLEETQDLVLGPLRRASQAALDLDGAVERFRSRVLAPAVTNAALRPSGPNRARRDAVQAALAEVLADPLGSRRDAVEAALRDLDEAGARRVGQADGAVQLLLSPPSSAPARFLAALRELASDLGEVAPASGGAEATDLLTLVRARRARLDAAFSRLAPGLANGAAMSDADRQLLARVARVAESLDATLEAARRVGGPAALARAKLRFLSRRLALVPRLAPALGEAAGNQLAARARDLTAQVDRALRASAELEGRPLKAWLALASPMRTDLEAAWRKARGGLTTPRPLAAKDRQALTRVLWRVVVEAFQLGSPGGGALDWAEVLARLEAEQHPVGGRIRAAGAVREDLETLRKAVSAAVQAALGGGGALAAAALADVEAQLAEAEAGSSRAQALAEQLEDECVAVIQQQRRVIQRRPNYAHDQAARKATLRQAGAMLAEARAALEPAGSADLDARRARLKSRLDLARALSGAAGLGGPRRKVLAGFTRTVRTGAAGQAQQAELEASVQALVTRAQQQGVQLGAQDEAPLAAAVAALAEDTAERVADLEQAATACRQRDQALRAGAAASFEAASARLDEAAEAAREVARSASSKAVVELGREANTLKHRGRALGERARRSDQVCAPDARARAARAERAVPSAQGIQNRLVREGPAGILAQVRLLRGAVERFRDPKQGGRWVPFVPEPRHEEFFAAWPERLAKLRSLSARVATLRDMVQRHREALDALQACLAGETPGPARWIPTGGGGTFGSLGGFNGAGGGEFSTQAGISTESRWQAARKRIATFFRSYADRDVGTAARQLAPAVAPEAVVITNAMYADLQVEAQILLEIQLLDYRFEGRDRVCTRIQWNRTGFRTGGASLVTRGVCRVCQDRREEMRFVQLQGQLPFGIDDTELARQAAGGQLNTEEAFGGILKPEGGDPETGEGPIQVQLNLDSTPGGQGNVAVVDFEADAVRKVTTDDPSAVTPQAGEDLVISIPLGTPPITIDLRAVNGAGVVACGGGTARQLSQMRALDASALGTTADTTQGPVVGVGTGEGNFVFLRVPDAPLANYLRDDDTLIQPAGVVDCP